jgi:hypothetical protein
LPGPAKRGPAPSARLVYLAGIFYDTSFKGGIGHDGRDYVFGPRFLPKDREPPIDVGIGGMDAFPTGFLAQWWSPFRWAQIRRDSLKKS